MASIRVSKGVVPIEVNDNGDTIELRTDADFMKSCLHMQQAFKTSKDAYDAVMSDESATTEQQEAVIDQMFQQTDGAINRLFGPDACNKIFPGTRSAMQYGEFFEQLTLIITNQQLQAAGKYRKQHK